MPNRVYSPFSERSPERSRTQRGASLIEVAIGIPVFMVFFTGVLYLSYVMAIKAALDRAAHVALTTAAVDPDISKISHADPQHPGLVTYYNPAECSDSSTNDFCKAINRVKTRVSAFATGTLLGGSPDSRRVAYLKADSPVFYLPTPAPGESVAHAFEKTPISIEVKAYVKNILPWFGNFELVSRAVGYKEINTDTSHTVLVDCRGNRIGSDNYWKQACDCTGSPVPNSVWVDSERSCISCAKHELNHQDANHPLPAVNHADTPGCYCPSTAYCQSILGEGAVFSDNEGKSPCTCVCNSGIGYISDPVTHQCVCPTPGVKMLTGEATGGHNPAVVPIKILTGVSDGTPGCNHCMVDDGNGATHKLNQDDCNALYPSLPAGEMIPQQDGCRCRCHARNLDCGRIPNCNGPACFLSCAADPCPTALGDSYQSEWQWNSQYPTNSDGSLGCHRCACLPWVYRGNTCGADTKSLCDPTLESSYYLNWGTDPNKTYNSDTQSCECKDSTPCPDGFARDPHTCACMCLKVEATDCAPGMVLVRDSCTCQCPPGNIDQATGECLTITPTAHPA